MLPRSQGWLLRNCTSDSKTNCIWMKLVHYSLSRFPAEAAASFSRYFDNHFISLPLRTLGSASNQDGNLSLAIRHRQRKNLANQRWIKLNCPIKLRQFTTLDNRPEVKIFGTGFSESMIQGMAWRDPPKYAKQWWSDEVSNAGNHYPDDTFYNLSSTFRIV